MGQDFNGAQQGTMKEDVKQQIVQLGLDYRLMTQFTSFVAVEEMIVTDGGQPRRIDVPVEVPEGVNRTAVFAQRDNSVNGSLNFSRVYANPSTVVVTSSGSSSAKTKSRRAGGGGGGYGMGRGGNATGSASAGGAPPPPAAPKAIAGLAMDETVAMRKLSPNEQKRADLQSKLHPSVLAVIDRLKDPKAGPGADEAKFVRNEKAELQIWLTEKSDETMAKLKELGFEVVLDPKTAKMVIGRLPIEKLAALSELKFVRYVAPQMAAN
jgi:hypothetical protein